MYDIAEKLYKKGTHYETNADSLGFETELNQFFQEHGIGWQMTEGHVETRGDASFEAAVTTGTKALKKARMPNAEEHLNEARSDLSRRPKPDLSGAIHHAMAALESVARAVTKKPKPTLGELVSELDFPRPLDDVVHKIWGYSSNVARHGTEAAAPEREEAELLVALAASLSVYLLGKAKT